MAGKEDANGAGLTPYGFKAVRTAPSQTAHVRLRIFNGREMDALPERNNLLAHYPFLCLKDHSLSCGRNMHPSGQIIDGIPFQSLSFENNTFSSDVLEQGSNYFNDLCNVDDN